VAENDWKGGPVNQPMLRRWLVALTSIIGQYRPKEAQFKAAELRALPKINAGFLERSESLQIE